MGRWWLTSLIPALRRQRQEDLRVRDQPGSKEQVLGRTAGATQKNPVSRKPKKIAELPAHIFILLDFLFQVRSITSCSWCFCLFPHCILFIFEHVSVSVLTLLVSSKEMTRIRGFPEDRPSPRPILVSVLVSPPHFILCTRHSCLFLPWLGSCCFALPCH